MPARLVVSLALAVFGGWMAAAPAAHARFSERIDAIGSTTPWTRVEPAEWKVTLTRWLGLFVVAAGLYIAYAAVTA